MSLTEAQPTDIYTLSLHDALPISVTATGITVSAMSNLGKDLARNLSWSLQASVTAATGLDVTLASSDSAKLLLASSPTARSEEHTSELESHHEIVSRVQLYNMTNS